MGLQPHPNGVTLKFVEKDGITPRKPFSVKGFAKFFSTPRAQLRGQPDPANPGPELGSKDWLTDVLVADTQARLDQLRPISNLQALTSTASLQVRVQWETNASSGNEPASVTIAPLGNLTMQLGDPHAITDELLVLPADTDIRLLVANTNFVVIDHLRELKASSKQAPALHGGSIQVAGARSS